MSRIAVDVAKTPETHRFLQIPATNLWLLVRQNLDPGVFRGLHFATPRNLPVVDRLRQRKASEAAPDRRIRRCRRRYARRKSKSILITALLPGCAASFGSASRSQFALRTGYGRCLQELLTRLIGSAKGFSKTCQKPHIPIPPQS